MRHRRLEHVACVSLGNKTFEKLCYQRTSNEGPLAKVKFRNLNIKQKLQIYIKSKACFGSEPFLSLKTRVKGGWKDRRT
jgi:hypothetical protein